MAPRLILAALFLAACGPAIPPPVTRPAPVVPIDSDVGGPDTPVPLTPQIPQAPAVFNDDVGQNPLKIHMIDVGQGDALFIESPTGKRVLIDSGPAKARTSLISWLDQKGVTRLDLIINSHPHADHIANTWKVIETRDVGLVLDSGVPHTGRDYEKLLDAVERKGVPFQIARKGRSIDLGGGAKLHVLGPEEPLVKGSRSDINANSVVVRLDYGQVGVLFTGDAETETEHRLLALGAEELQATILKVAHHGSKHATGADLLGAVNPRVALISCAQDNNYGHPAPATLSRLKAAGVSVFETRLHGTITVATDGKGLRIETEKAGAGDPVVVAAEAPEEEAVAAARLDLNTATREALIELPGIGPATADRILAWRQANGPFKSVEQLGDVPGVGPRTLERLRPLVSVVPLGS